jgi:hypothetical protein
MDTERLVRVERQQWRKQHKLSSDSLSDFQKLADEAFHELRQKYFSPADLVAELVARRLSNRKRRSIRRVRTIADSP